MFSLKSLLFIVFAFTWCCDAQEMIAQGASDTLIVSNADTSEVFKSKFRRTFSSKWHMQPHSPLKATVFSAIVPGLGQIYNGRAKQGSVIRKYWKVPVVVIGIGTCVGFIDYNTRNYRYHRQQYIYEVDNDNNTNADATYLGLNSEYMEYHKKLLDISYFSLAGVYLLQIIEANSDAHLFYYDISKDLSLHVYPTLLPQAANRPGIGILLSF